ncbi:MAG TPA: hypothetical protein VH144_03085, partial [Candidatus Saccharimonadales bacterium]|nr:hypothetical protein [Candidatus Saccharimonadales bacterium]
MSSDDREQPLETKSIEQQIADIELADEQTVQPGVEAPIMTPQPVSISGGQNRWQRWVHSWKFWLIIGITLLVVLLVTAWFVSFSRYAALNLLRVHGDLSVSAVTTSDGTARIKNFAVIVDGKRYTTGQKETIDITNLTFGTHIVTVSKDGYQDYSHSAVVDFNPFFGLIKRVDGSMNSVVAKLKSIGTSITFTVKDAMSDTPLDEGSFTLGDTTVDASTKGIVKLLVPPTDATKVSVKATFGGNYIDKTFMLDLHAANQSFSFVPAGRHYFVSKQTGVYSVFSTNLDGSDQKQLIAGTSQETASLLFAVSPSGKYGVMASTRDGTRDTDGNVLQKLYRVDLNTGALDPLDQGSFFTFYDWSGDTLAYSYGYKEPKATEFSRRLRSIDASTKNLYDLGTTTGAYMRVSVVSGSVISLQTEAANQPTAANSPWLKMTNIKGGNQKDLASQVADLHHIDNDTFLYQTADKRWLRLQVSTNQVSDAAPPSATDRIFMSLTSPRNNNLQVVLDTSSNGQTSLSVRDTKGKEQKLASAVGLGGPIRWVDETT